MTRRAPQRNAGESFKPDSEPCHGFLSWARDSMTSMPSSDGDQCVESIAAAVGGARVVGLGEAVHGGREILEFRNGLFRSLVESHGFTAIAIESGIVEARAVYEYVRFGKPNLTAALSSGLSWGFDRLPENRTLIEWIRDHNESGSGRPVHFYGFDLPGSPGLGRARRGVRTAVCEVLAYLSAVDPKAADRLSETTNPLMPYFRFDPTRAPSEPGYDRLLASQRDSLTGAIADVVALFERQEESFSRQSGFEAYDWAYRAALNAREVDQWLRQIPLGWQPKQAPMRLEGEAARFLSAANEVRDRAQAKNLQWILHREGPDGRVLVYAHRYHVSAAPVRASWAGAHEHSVMGTYLRRQFGAQFISIGNLIGEGEVGTLDGREILEPAPAGSFDALAGEVGAAAYFLDLRQAPSDVQNWLSAPRVLGFGTTGRQAGVIELDVRRAFDVLLYQDRVSPT